MRHSWARLEQAGVGYIIVFVVFFIGFIYFSFNLAIGDPDGFYHAKIALLLSQGTLLYGMPWMQATTLRQAFTDHHFLYHILLVPFVRLGDPLLGVKLATALFGAAFFTTFAWFLRRLRGAAPYLFSFLLFLTSSFTFRLGLVKANSLSLILFVCIIVALVERRTKLIIFLNALYVWLYGGWLLGWVAAAVYALVFWFSKKEHGKRVAVVQLVGATIVGSAIGLIVNPYFPGNISFYWQQVWQIAIVHHVSGVFSGGEWSPLAPHEMVTFFTYTIIFYISAITLLITERRSIKPRSWFVVLLSFVFILFTIKSRRYIELSAPTVVMAASFIYADIFPHGTFSRWWRSWHGYGDRVKRAFSQVLFVGAIIIVVLPTVGLWPQIQLTHDQLQGGVSFHRYERAAAWLTANTPLHSTVLHSDWDDWPMLFYHNDHNYYIVGLDPIFMYNYNPALYKAWVGVTRDGRADDLATLVDIRLGASYTIIEKDHTAMQQLFATNVYFRLVYEDDEVWVYATDRKAIHSST